MTVVTKPRDDTRENRVFSNEYLLGLDAAGAAVRASGEVMLIAAVLAEAKMAAREEDDATRLNATNDAGLMLRGREEGERGRREGKGDRERNGEIWGKREK